MPNAYSVTIQNPVYTLNEKLQDVLYPAIQPYDEGFLKVSNIHTIWYAQYGNPKGVPVIVIHGGPGFGCGPNDMRFFDPSHYRIVLFDQRGAKRSTPIGETQENTTADLIGDIELLREHLAISKWLVFGGSWGSALSMLYGEAHPERCLGFILRGVFLGRKSEYEQVWYGMGDMHPEIWEEFQALIPIEERNDLIKAYHTRLMDPNQDIHLPAAMAFIKYDLSCAMLIKDMDLINRFLENQALVVGAARIFSHYCLEKFYLEENQIIKHLPRIQHLPVIIIHGRYDTICRPKSAYELHQKWPGSQLIFVQDAGHMSGEPGIAKALVEAMEKVK